MDCYDLSVRNYVTLDDRQFFIAIGLQLRSSPLDFGFPDKNRVLQICSYER